MSTRSLTARVILPIAVIAYWTVGFYPFQWFSPIAVYENKATYTGKGGVSFQQRGIAHTATAPPWVRTAIAHNRFEVELEIHSYDRDQSGPARIFTISRDHYYRNFTIGQSGSTLEVRIRTPVSGANGQPGYKIPGVFHDLESTRVMVAVTPDFIRVYVNGHERLIDALPEDPLDTWNPNYRLALGNELTFQRPWRGEIESIRIQAGQRKYSMELTDLTIPEYYALSPNVLLSSLRNVLAIPVNVSDWIINVIGFVPFGFLLAILRRDQTSFVLACMGCAGLSFSIESGQLLLENRSAQASDLVLNTFGGALGVLTAYWLYPRPRNL